MTSANNFLSIRSMKFNNTLIIFLSLLIGLFYSTVAQNRAAVLSERLLDGQDDYVFVIAHRADWRNAPENSLEAIRGAIAISVDMVEIDLRKTKDNQLVVIHDATVDRTTNGLGKVSDWTLDSLRTLYLKNGQGRITRFKIPTLEEALLVAKGEVLVNLDKSYNYFDQVYEVLIKTETINQVVMKAKKPYEVVEAEFGAFLDEVIFMPIVDLKDPKASQWIEDYIASGRVVAFELIFNDDKYLTKDIINTIKKAGLRIWINSLWDGLNGGHSDNLALTDLNASYGWIVDQGVTLIQTDRPELLIQFLESRNLHD